MKTKDNGQILKKRFLFEQFKDEYSRNILHAPWHPEISRKLTFHCKWHTFSTLKSHVIGILIDQSASWAHIYHVSPQLQYCLSAWVGAHTCHLDRLQNVVNFDVRLETGSADVTQSPLPLRLWAGGGWES